MVFIRVQHTTTANIQEKPAGQSLPQGRGRKGAALPTTAGMASLSEYSMISPVSPRPLPGTKEEKRKTTTHQPPVPSEASDANILKDSLKFKIPKHTGKSSPYPPFQKCLCLWLDLCDLSLVAETQVTQKHSLFFFFLTSEEVCTILRH